MLRRWFDNVVANKEELAKLVALEVVRTRTHTHTHTHTHAHTHMHTHTHITEGFKLEWIIT